MGIFSKHRIFCGKDGKLHDEDRKEVQPISDPVFDMIESSMLDQINVIDKKIKQNTTKT